MPAETAEITEITALREAIEFLFTARPAAYQRADHEVFARFKEALNQGAVRAAEPDPAAPAGWRVNPWVKQGILLGFRLGAIVDMTIGSATIGTASLPFFDKSTYPLRHLDTGSGVRIVPGGPQANNRLLLISGKVDFFMGANMIQALDAVKEGVPTLAVASMFQKDPLVYMSHPGVGLDRIEDLSQAGAYFVAKDNLVTAFQWAKQTYGFKEEKVKPYAFNPAPFIADRNAVQQGYLTSEPFEVEKQGGFKPNVFLIADYGWDSY